MEEATVLYTLPLPFLSANNLVRNRVECMENKLEKLKSDQEEFFVDKMTSGGGDTRRLDDMQTMILSKLDKMFSGGHREICGDQAQKNEFPEQL
jgi:hypothetical protein